MDQRRAAAALLALAACFACSTAAPTSNNQTALDLYDAPVEGCYYNFQHYGEGDRIMTNEPCLNCTCHNRMLMCYLRVCPFTKPIGQDCTVEKRADQCCPIVTCPDVPVDLLTSTSTSSPAEYGATGLGKLDKYGCSINGKYFPEGSKVPPAPNKPCEHCYCIRNMTTCVMQECTLHVDGCTPIYHKDVCCPIRYSCDHPEDEIPLLDDMTTTVRPTPGFLLTTTTIMPVTQASQDCIHDDQIFADGALIKTEKACEHCYCMKGDIVCVVQECGTPMENEGKNCTSLPPRQGQCCPDTYICEGDETQTASYEEITTLSPPRRVGVEGSGYRNEDEPYTGMPSLESELEGSGEDQPITTIESFDTFTTTKRIPETTSEYIYQYSTEPDKGLNTVPDSIDDQDKTERTEINLAFTARPDSSTLFDNKLTEKEDTTVRDSTNKIVDETTKPIETSTLFEFIQSTSHSTKVDTTTKPNDAISTSDNMTPFDEGFILATKLPDKSDNTDSVFEEEFTTMKPLEIEELDNSKEQTTIKNVIFNEYTTVTTEKISVTETTSINVQENEIVEDLTPGRIPGEGDCLLNSITYKNNTSVPSTSKCHSSCKCISSIIKCDPIICTPPLEYMENMNDCHPIYDSPESCCPTYICNTKETAAPESHSQMSGTETPKPTIECAGDECKIIEETKPIIDHEIPDESDCGKNGCIETSVPQKDLGECVGGVCDTHNVQYPIDENKPCSDTGCQAPPVKPCDSSDCRTDLESPIHDEKDTEEKPIDTTLPINEDQEIICEGENCRRKEFGSVDQEIQCLGNNCLNQPTVPSASGVEINTQKTDTETTIKPQFTDVKTTYTESTTVSGLFTEKIQTTFPHISEQTLDDSHHEEIDTQSPHTHDISTERLEPIDFVKNDQTTESAMSDTDKIYTTSHEDVDKHITVVTENYGTSKDFTPELTEKSIDGASKITVSKIETEESTARTEEFTKVITTESYIVAETTRPEISIVDTSMSSQETEILDQQPITQGSIDITSSPYLEDKTTIRVHHEEITPTNIPKLATTISDESVTENVNIGTNTEKEITNVEHTDKPKDAHLLEVTKMIESTTAAYPGLESSSHITPTDYTNYETLPEDMGDKKIPEIHESSTIHTEITKQDDKDEQATIAKLSTPKEDIIFDVTSTPIYKVETTESASEYEKNTSSHEPITLSPDIKEFDDQKGHEPISTNIPEQHTQVDVVETTPPIQYDDQHSATSGTTIVSDIYTERPNALSTDSKLYSPVQETGISDSEIATEQPKLTSNDLEHQTEILSSTQSPIKEEQSDKFTPSPEEVVTTSANREEEKESTLNLELTTKSFESIYPVTSETKPSEGMIQQDETDTKTTLTYNEYYETTKEATATEVPVIVEHSTTADKVIEVATVIPQDDIKLEHATTEIPVLHTEVSSVVSSEKPKLDYTLAEEITEAITSMPQTDIPNIINDSKPASTISELSQDLYPSTTMKNFENSETTQKSEINFIVPEETATEIVPDTHNIDDLQKITTIFTEITTKAVPVLNDLDDIQQVTTVFGEITTEKVSDTHDIGGVKEVTTLLSDEIATEKVPDIHDISDKENVSTLSDETATEQVPNKHDMGDVEMVTTVSEEISTEKVPVTHDIVDEEKVTTFTDNVATEKAPDAHDIGEIERETTVLDETATEKVPHIHDIGDKEKVTTLSDEIATEKVMVSHDIDDKEKVTTLSDEIATEKVPDIHDIGDVEKITTVSEDISTEKVPIIHDISDKEKATTLSDEIATEKVPVTHDTGDKEMVTTLSDEIATERVPVTHDFSDNEKVTTLSDEIATEKVPDAHDIGEIERETTVLDETATEKVPHIHDIGDKEKVTTLSDEYATENVPVMHDISDKEEVTTLSDEIATEKVAVSHDTGVKEKVTTLSDEIATERVPVTNDISDNEKVTTLLDEIATERVPVTNDISDNEKVTTLLDEIVTETIPVTHVAGDKVKVTTLSDEISTEKILDTHDIGDNERVTTMSDEIATEKLPVIYDLGHKDKITTVSADTNPSTATYEESVTEKAGSTERVDIITPQTHDLRDTESIPSTTSSALETVTEQKIEEITDITHVKEIKTESPMSLVTGSQSYSTEPAVVTETAQKVTDSELTVDVHTESHIVDKKPSSETAFVEESFTTKRSETENKDIIAPSQPITEHKYSTPTTESSFIVTTMESELSTAKLFTSQQFSSENPLLGFSEQQSEKESTLETTQSIIDLIISSTTETSQLEDQSKENVPETVTTNVIKLTTELEEEKEKAPSSEQSITHIDEQATQGLKDITKIPTEISTDGHEISVSEETTKYPQPSATEAQEDSENITDEPLLHTTDSGLEVKTPSKEVDIDETVTMQSPTTIKPILSTISLDNEIVYEPESTTKAQDKFSDSIDSEENTYSGQTTQTETLVTKIAMPDHSSTETYQETKEHTASADETSTVPDVPKPHHDQSQDDAIHSTESAIHTPDENVTEVSNESTSLQDKEIKPTLTDTIITSSERISDLTETTTETKYKFSETTSYFVELEEHTHQNMQETTVIPVDVSTVETTAIKSTERGDQLFSDISIEDSQTEKSNEMTSESDEIHGTTPQLIEEQSNQEKYQTTASALEIGTTTISVIESQNATNTKGEENTTELGDKTTISPLPNIVQNEERVTLTPEGSEKPTSYFDTKTPTTTEISHDLGEGEPDKQVIPLETKTPDEERITTKLTTSQIVYESTTVTPVKTTLADDIFKPVDTSITPKPIYSKPPSDIQPTEEIPTPEFPSSGYDQEPDYGEEDQAFGPGTCRYGGKVYVSAQQIPRDDPCDFCFCFRSDIICLQQSCPPPIHGCHEEPIQGFCCPRYECPVSMATTVNVTTTTTTTTTTLPPHFLPHAYKGAAQRKGCHIKGHTYKVGEVVRASSGPCLHCTCGGDGQMKCDPKACTPEPMLRQMIAAAVSARRR